MFLPQSVLGASQSCGKKVKDGEKDKKVKPPADLDLLAKLVETYFDRKIVKKIFMPIVYGKTQFAAAKDLAEKIGQSTSIHEIRDLTKVCFQYWGIAYAGMKNLMSLVACISWVAAAMQQPVILSNKYWVTHQDYFLKDKVRVTLSYTENTPEGKSKTKRAVMKPNMSFNTNPELFSVRFLCQTGGPPGIS